MARVLEMTFNTELGTSKTMRVTDAKDPLTGTEVAAWLLVRMEQCMEMLTAAICIIWRISYDITNWI